MSHDQPAAGSFRCRAHDPTPAGDSRSFPILTQRVHGKPLVFLDSAASAMKPNAVIDAMSDTMRTQYANVHRGLHWMSERTTDAYESTRDAVARLLNAPSRDEIVFAKNSTEAINLLAHSYGSLLRPGQAVLITEMEHHANMVPWQMLRDRAGIELRVAQDHRCRRAGLGPISRPSWPMAASGLVAMTHMSNVLGTYTPAARIAAAAHAAGCEGDVRRQPGRGAPPGRRAGAGC